MNNRRGHHQQSNQQRIWQTHIKTMAQSGLSRAEYCRRHNISYHTLSYWQRKLARPTSRSLTLVPVNLPVTIAPNSANANHTALTLLLPGKLAIAVGDNFSSATLHKLLTLLENR